MLLLFNLEIIFELLVKNNVMQLMCTTSPQTTCAAILTSPIYILIAKNPVYFYPLSTSTVVFLPRYIPEVGVESPMNRPILWRRYFWASAEVAKIYIFSLAKIAA